LDQSPAAEHYFEWQTDISGTPVFLSPSFREITGLSPEGVLGVRCFGDVDAGRALQFEQAVRECLISGRSFGDLRLVANSGRDPVELVLSGGAGDDPAGKIVSGRGFRLTTRIVPGVRSEDLRQPDTGILLKSAQELGQCGYTYLDGASDRIFVAGPFRAILGLDGDYTTPAHIRACMVADDVPGYEKAKKSALDGHGPAQVECRFTSDNKDLRYVLIQFEVLTGEHGEVTNIVTSNQDITEQRRIEAALLESQRVSRLGHWRRSLIEEKTDWSASMREILGADAAVGTTQPNPSITEELVHPEDRQRFISERNEAIAEHRDYDTVLRVVRLDGPVIWARIRGRPSYGEDGSLIGTLGTVQDITDIKQLEFELLRSQHDFRRAQRLARIGHWTFDPLERLVRLSETAQQIFEVPGRDIVNFEDILQRVHPTDRAFFEHMKELVKSADPGFEKEIRVIRADGSVSHLQVSAEFDYDESGRLLRTFGVVLDVSTRIRAEAARRDVEAVMTDVFENADAGILVSDLSGRFLRVNTRAAIQLGLRVDDILGHTVEEVLAKSDRMEPAEMLRDAAYRVSLTRGSATYDYTYKPDSGGPVTEFRVVNFPVSGPDGSVRAIASMRSDITEFVQAQTALKNLNDSLEQTIRARTQELRNSEGRFRNIASASADWFWELDADLKLVWCSDNFLEQMGRKAEDHIGKPLASLISEQERRGDQKEAWDAIEEKLRSRSPIRGIEIERKNLHGVRVVRINAKPLWTGGNFVGFHGSSTDITELKRAQGQLIEAERLASLGGLVAGISHEINTPVGASYTVVTKLTNSLAELRSGYEAQKISQSMFNRVVSEFEQGLGIIQRGLERTSELISRFKQVAVDQTSLKRRSFSLAEMTGDIVATMEATIGGRNLAIESRIPEAFELDSYPGPLGQVMINLIQNAIVHGFDGEPGEDGRIVIMATQIDTETLALTVSDNGKGMTANVVRRVFEPFFTTRFGNGGSGLGMHLVYSIVHGVLGGEVSVSSEPGNGTAVVISLPLVAPDASEHETAAGA